MGVLPLQLHISSSTIAEFLIASAWQGIAVSILVAVLFKLLPTMSATHRFRIWMSAFLLTALLPLTSFVHLGEPASTVVAAMAAPNHADTFFTLSMYWSWAFILLWAVMVAYSCLRLVAGIWGIHQLLRNAVPMTDFHAPDQEDFLRKSSRKRVRILVADSLRAPVATGFLHPVIVIPRYLLQELTQEEMSQILRHEYEHLARWDDWTTLLVRTLRCLLPLSPALYYIEKQLCRERELACDDAVLTHETSPRGYAHCLARMAEMSMNQRNALLAPGLLGETSQLTARVSHILGSQGTMQEMARLPFAMSLLSMPLIASALLYCPSVVSFRPLPSSSPEVALNQPQAAQLIEAKPIAAAMVTPQRAAISYNASPRLLAKSHPSAPVSVNPLPAMASDSNNDQTLKMLVLWQQPVNAPEPTVFLLIETTSLSDRSITIQRQLFQI